MIAALTYLLLLSVTFAGALILYFGLRAVKLI
ncbi:MAG: cytochrome b6-f complex subunit 6 [Cyanothece sp. SIO1E1]|nr:cytochrome b6-f complex subunit 6 [Cyanothece sp. SIO1E1]